MLRVKCMIYLFKKVSLKYLWKRTYRKCLWILMEGLDNCKTKNLLKITPFFKCLPPKANRTFRSCPLVLLTWTWLISVWWWTKENQRVICPRQNILICVYLLDKLDTSRGSLCDASFIITETNYSQRLIQISHVTIKRALQGQALNGNFDHSRSDIP